MHDIQLLEFYAQGWVPAPKESLQVFYKRIQAFQIFKEALQDEAVESLPFYSHERAPTKLQAQAEKETANYYGTVLTGVPLFFSSKTLFFWQGALTWVYQFDESGPKVTLIQLSPKFATQKLLWGLYDRDELLIHELAHAGRGAFNEPQFEEIIAYASSKSPWRRFFGPLFATHSESQWMMLLITMVIFLEALAVFWQWSISIFGLWMAPICGAFVLLTRLIYRQHIFKKALSHLKEAFEKSGNTQAQPSAQSVLYCLSDAEIRQLAKHVDVVAEMLKKGGEDAPLHERLIALLIKRGLDGGLVSLRNTSGLRLAPLASQIANSPCI